MEFQADGALSPRLVRNDDAVSSDVGSSTSEPQRLRWRTHFPKDKTRLLSPQEVSFPQQVVQP